MSIDYSSNDPIIACSSGHSHNVAISVIRLSGFKDLEFLRPHISKDISKISARTSHFVKLKKDNVILDEVLLFFYPAPHSYNGENILELNVHGNILNVERILNLFINAGFRYADAGEFTYRALKNKKLSLSQVEGLDLFLNASSPLALEQGFSLLNGDLQKAYEDLYQTFLNHKSALELGIDFLDDIGEEAFDENFNRTLSLFEKQLLKFKSRLETESSSLLSPEVVLLGRPNAGKSTFFNSLLRFDRSIVTSEEGTTRDYVSEKLKIKDVLYNLIDTAGLRETSNRVEAIGIEKTKEKASKAFYRILLVNPFDKNIELIKQYLLFPLDLIVFTHADLEGFSESFNEIKTIFGPIEPTRFASGPIEPKDFSGSIGAKNETGPMGAEVKKDGSIGPKFCFLNVNDVNSDSYDLILNLISNKFNNLTSNSPILLERQKYCLIDLLQKFSDYKQILINETDISIISSELNILGHCISELIGIVSPDDVLHNIFANFCIGK